MITSRPRRDLMPGTRPVTGPLRDLSGVLAARRLAARLVRGPSWQWDLSAGLDAVSLSLVAPGNRLDELAVPKVQRRKVVGCPSGRQRSRVHKPAKERPALRVRVLVRTGRAGKKTEAIRQ